MSYDNQEVERKIKSILSYILALLMFYLAANALIASSHINDDVYSYATPNLYLDRDVLLDRQHASVIERESKALEFMVWGHERSNLSRALIENLKARINLSPTNGRLWNQLIYLQRDAGVTMIERAWSIERALRLNRWNFLMRSELSHYCIVEYDAFSQLSPALCSSVLMNLPQSWSDKVTASKANVNLQALQAVLISEKKKQEKIQPLKVLK